MKYYKIIILVGFASLIFFGLLDNNNQFSDKEENYHAIHYKDDIENMNDILEISATDHFFNWSVRWSGPNHEQAYGMIYDSEDYIYITGYTNSYGAGSSDIILIKYNLEGKEIWNRTWGGLGSDIGKDLISDPLGNFYVTGWTSSYGVGGYDACIVKFDNNGNYLWNVTWGGSASDEPNGVAIDSLGYIYIVGTTASFGMGNDDIFIVKFDSNGNRQWNHTWGGSHWDEGYGIAIDQYNDIYITGYTRSYGSGNLDVCIIKYDIDGNELWSRVWGAEWSETGRAIDFDSSNNVIVCGYCPDGALILKYDSEGNFIWNTHWMTSDYRCYDITIDHCDNIYTTGHIWDDDGFLVKFSPEGDYKWHYEWGNPSHDEDSGEALILDKYNNILLTGTYEVNGINKDIYLAKYNYPNVHVPFLTNDSVSPISGIQSTLFNFSINYQDLDNNPPISINVTINSTSYSMMKVSVSDTNYTDGCTYQYLTYLAPSAHNYTFSFQCNDGKYNNSTMTYNSLEVNEINNLAPYLMNAQVLPELGNTSIKYSYTVWYFDEENNLPMSINITINSTSYSMVQVDPYDKNAMDGILYIYTTDLDAGYYKFQIICSDSKYTNSTEWIFSPEVNPFCPYIIFEDDFEDQGHVQDPVPDWASIGVTITSQTANSGIYSLCFHGEWLYNTIATSKVFDLSLKQYKNLSYWLRRGGNWFSNSPEDGEDFVVEYYNNLGSWIEFNKFLGSGTAGQIYEINSILPVDALHSNFQIRFRRTAGDSGLDCWHLDDVKIIDSPSPKLLFPNNECSIFTDMKNFTWTISNGALVNYTLQISNSSDFSYLIFEAENIEGLPGVSNLTKYIDFSSGLYYWRVCATWKFFMSKWSKSCVFNLTYNENPPSFQSNLVIPKIGNQYSGFNFTLDYIDQDGNKPLYVNLTINGTSYSMEKVDPFDKDYSDGCVYQYLTYLNPSQYNYTYTFTCSDGKYSFSTIVFNNLDVKETSLYKPRLLNPQLVPFIGNESTIFNFTIWYFDDDNQLPLYVNISINDTSISMAQVNPFDINALDGILFYYATSLDFGYYRFQINCSDGFSTNSTEWISGPEVNPFYKYGNITLIGPSDSSTFFTGIINFTWFSLDASFGTVNYTIQISDSADFSFILHTLEYINEKPIVTNATLFVDLPSRQYFWRVRATYKIFYGNWSNVNNFNLTLNHDQPHLIFGSVQPKVGDQTTNFNFTVIYIDLDNNHPIYINLVINGTSYIMEKVEIADNHYTNGCLYQYLTFLAPSYNNYSYYFICNDGKYENYTGIYQDLERLELNYNSLPQLVNPSVSPNSGQLSTIFNFTVWYFDDDNNFPQYVNISINENIYSMIPVNPFDINATNGIEFYYLTSLLPEYIEFQINCSDGFFLNSTNWIPGPDVGLISRNAYALIIGVENYPGSSYDLSYCADDALSMRNFLMAEYNFKEENIYLLLDSAGTYSNIGLGLSIIENKINPDDKFFFYFSGHGGEDYPGSYDEFICPYDSISNPSKYIYDWMLDMWIENIDCAEKYIILDSCYSGGFLWSGGFIEFDDDGEFFMTSCFWDELCLEDPQLQHGIFTYYFLNAHNEISDSNGDGVKSLEECFSYISSETKARSSILGYQHRPLKAEKISGPSVLYPALSLESITFNTYQLNYSFNFYGNGFINSLDISLYSGGHYIKSINLLFNSPSDTGFGYYSGTIQLEGNYKITQYDIVANVTGNNVVILKISYLEPSDGSSGSSSKSQQNEKNIQDSSSTILIMTSVVGVLVSICIAIYLKKKPSSKEFSMKSVDQKPIIPRSVETRSPVEIPLNIKYCTMCGAPMKVSQKFCTQCGRSLMNQ